MRCDHKKQASEQAPGIEKRLGEIAKSNEQPEPTTENLWTFLSDFLFYLFDFLVSFISFSFLALGLHFMAGHTKSSWQKCPLALPNKKKKEKKKMYNAKLDGWPEVLFSAQHTMPCHCFRRKETRDGSMCNIAWKRFSELHLKLHRKKNYKLFPELVY